MLVSLLNYHSHQFLHLIQNARHSSVGVIILKWIEETDYGYLHNPVISSTDVKDI